MSISEKASCRYNSVKMLSYWIRVPRDLVTGEQRQLTTHREKAIGLRLWLQPKALPGGWEPPAGGERRGRVPPQRLE